MAENYKLAVVGNESSVLIFKSLGCKIFPVFSEKEAEKQAETLFRAHLEDEDKTPEYAVVFVEEDYYKTFSDDLVEKFTLRALPAVIPVPSMGQKDGESFATIRLRKIVEKAIGSDILG
jgi:vacuolar-type H+-ATPase subunit F/Vma7